jgi:hypothetical protein
MALRDTLTTLAASFVEAIMEAVRTASLAELSGGSSETEAEPAPRRGRPLSAKPSKPAKTTQSGRLARRSTEQIEAVVADIAALLKKKGGMRSEDIREELSLDRREIPLVIKHGLETEAFVVLSGQKRSTTYGIRGAAKPGPKPAKKMAKKAAKKVAKKAAKKAKKTVKKPGKVKKAVKKTAKAKKPGKVKKTAEQTPEKAADVAAQ